MKLDNKYTVALQGKLMVLVDIFINIQVHWNTSTFDRLIVTNVLKDFNTSSTICYLKTQAGSSSETQANIS